MNVPPLDYALDDGAAFERARTTAPDDVTLAALLDRHAAALPVTDVMIRDAWRRLEAERGSTFAGAYGPAPAARRSAGAGGLVGRTLRLSRLFRAPA